MPSFRRLPLLLLFLVTALTLTGCKGSESATGEDEGPPKAPETVLEVVNRNFLDMTIYVLRGSQRVRLGRVTGSTTRRLTIPEYLTVGYPGLRFIADPTGSVNQPITREITIRQGEVIRFEIPAY